jgi:hypothetical protein
MLTVAVSFIFRCLMLVITLFTYLCDPDISTFIVHKRFVPLLLACRTQRSPPSYLANLSTPEQYWAVTTSHIEGYCGTELS